MHTIIGTCPHCGRDTFVTIGQPCANTLKDGTTCGYSLTTNLFSGNAFTREKATKHTCPPASGDTGDWSWATNPALHSNHHVLGLVSGDTYFDAMNNYFCSINPVASGDALVRYENSGSITDAFNSITPLNSKMQNLHTFYGQNTDGMVHIGTGDFSIASSGVSISGQSVKIFSVIQSGKVVAMYNPLSSGLALYS